MELLEILKKELDYKTTVAELLTTYIGNGDIQSFLKESLYSIANYLDVEGIYLFEFDMENKELSNTHGWSKQGGTIVRELLQNLTFHECKWIMERLKNEHFVSIPDIETIKDIAPYEYGLLKETGVSSLVDVLLMAEGKPWGFLGIEYKKEETPTKLVEKEAKVIGIILSNIIERYTMQSRIIKLSERDQLTNIYNRQKFIHVIANWHEAYTLFFIDIDQFKSINDTFGHEVGDRVIKGAASAIQSNIKGIHAYEYCLGRYGGDEFVLAIKTVDTEQIEQVNERLNESIHVECGDHYPLSIRLCVGYKYNEHGKNVKEIIQKADYAMYVGKKAHHKRSTNFETVSHQYEIETLVGKEFEGALKKKEIHPVFQPKVKIDKETVTSCEMFCRWELKNGQVLSPAMFLPAIEKSGKMHMLDFYMIEEACLFLQRLKEVHIEHSCSVNLSLKTLAISNVVDRIIEIVERYNIRPSQLTIEILENIFEFTNEEMKKKMERLRHIGFRISIDDFGLEYSSLSRLYNISFDEIKIPREFIVTIDSGVTKKIFELILLFAKSVGATTVVEGIETKEQLQTCVNKAVDYVQGYYYSKPLKANAYIDYISGKDVEKWRKETAKWESSLDTFSPDKILSLVPQPVFLLDENRRILYSNKRLEKQLKIDEKSVIGQLFGDAFNCKYALRDSGQCGQMKECRTCPIKSTIDVAFQTKEPTTNDQFKKAFFVDGEEKTMILRLYVAPYQSDVQNITVVMLEEIIEKPLA